MSIKVTEAPTCSHCGAKMEKYELPPVTFSDGLGWGTSFLWVCPSDDCPIFRKGFSHNMNNYGHTASLRSIVEPDTGRESVAPALSLDKEHFSDFVEIRKESMRKSREQDQTPSREDEDWPDDNPYDPKKGFTEA